MAILIWTEKSNTLGLPSQSAHPPSLNTGAPSCLADNILDISNAVYPYITISDHFDLRNWCVLSTKQEQFFWYFSFGWNIVNNEVSFKNHKNPQTRNSNHVMRYIRTVIRHYFFIPPILKGRSYWCMPQIFAAYTNLQHTCVCRRYICGIHEYDSCISLLEWEEWKNNVL